MALIEGQALLKQYSDRNIRKPEVKRLIGHGDDRRGRVAAARRVVPHDRHAARRPHARVAGRLPERLDPEPDERRGDAGKFESLAVPVIGAKRAASLAEQVMELEKVRDVSELMKLTAAR